MYYINLLQQTFGNEAHIITNKNLHLEEHKESTSLIKAPAIQGESVETINLEDNYVTILKKKYDLSFY